MSEKQTTEQPVATGEPSPAEQRPGTFWENEDGEATILENIGAWAAAHQQLERDQKQPGNKN